MDRLQQLPLTYHFFIELLEKALLNLAGTKLYGLRLLNMCMCLTFPHALLSPSSLPTLLTWYPDGNARERSLLDLLTAHSQELWLFPPFLAYCPVIILQTLTISMHFYLEVTLITSKPD